jgi:hypothetical protein
MLLIILLVLLFLSVGGGFGYYARYGAAGLSPAGLILVILLILYLTGRF